MRDVKGVPHAANDLEIWFCPDCRAGREAWSWHFIDAVGDQDHYQCPRCAAVLGEREIQKEPNV